MGLRLPDKIVLAYSIPTVFLLGACALDLYTGSEVFIDVECARSPFCSTCFAVLFPIVFEYMVRCVCKKWTSELSDAMKRYLNIYLVFHSTTSARFLAFLPERKMTSHIQFVLGYLATALVCYYRYTTLSPTRKLWNLSDFKTKVVVILNIVALIFSIIFAPVIHHSRDEMVVSVITQLFFFPLCLIASVEFSMVYDKETNAESRVEERVAKAEIQEEEHQEEENKKKQQVGDGTQTDEEPKKEEQRRKRRNLTNA